MSRAPLTLFLVLLVATSVAEKSLPPPMSVADLRSADFDVQLESIRDLEPGTGYSAYLIAYAHSGLRLHAMVAVPAIPSPASGFPIVFANHGYAPLLDAFPGPVRREYLSVGAEGEDSDWIGCSAHYTGVFEASWLDIPPNRLCVHICYFANGNYVAFCGWPAMRATVTGDGRMGIAPGSQQISFASLGIWRTENGRIRENWVMIDIPKVWHQLGVDVFVRMREVTLARQPIDFQT